MQMNSVDGCNERRSSWRSVIIPMGVFGAIGVLATFVFGIAHALITTTDAAVGWKVGILNSQMVQREFREYRDALQRLEQQRRTYQREIVQLRTYSMLTESEWNELSKLLNKSALSGAERRRLLELRGLHTQRAEEYNRLRSSPPDKLSPQQRRRLMELSSILEATKSRMKRLTDELQTKLDNLREQLQKRLEKRIREVAAQVARKRGLQLVLDHNALYFAQGDVIDITKQVIERLNASQ